MDAKLTVAIPTHNRAACLDRQLGWLAATVRSHASECEILLADNCSTDETPTVIERRRRELGGTRLRVHRHPRDIGAIRNIAWCISRARGSHVWTIGDDDRMDEGALAYVLAELDAHRDLGVLTLNFSSRLVRTGELRFERVYDFGDDQVHEDGRSLFARCLDSDPGGVALTTAQVYRSDLARRAIQEWPWGLRNLVAQIYWTGFCAANGPMKLTAETHLECAAGTHFFLSDPRLEFKLDLGDTVEMYARLMSIGYSPELSARLIRRQLHGNRRRIVRGLVRWPRVGFGVVFRIAKAWALVAARR
ncbi:MAG: glycosyltransferase family 2 protein [Candidatus Limnocylindria bacterium]